MRLYMHTGRTRPRKRTRRHRIQSPQQLQLPMADRRTVHCSLCGQQGHRLLYCTKPRTGSGPPAGASKSQVIDYQRKNIFELNAYNPAFRNKTALQLYCTELAIHPFWSDYVHRMGPPIKLGDRPSGLAFAYQNFANFEKQFRTRKEHAQKTPKQQKRADARDPRGRGTASNGYVDVTATAKRVAETAVTGAPPKRWSRAEFCPSACSARPPWPPTRRASPESGRSVRRQRAGVPAAARRSAWRAGGQQPAPRTALPARCTSHAADSPLMPLPTTATSSADDTSADAAPFFFDGILRVCLKCVVCAEC